MIARFLAEKGAKISVSTALHLGVRSDSNKTLAVDIVLRLWNCLWPASPYGGHSKANC